MVELKKKLSPFKRYALALGIFSIALLIRFALLSVDAGFPFVALVPATVICFYLCGIGPGILTAFIFANICYLIFVPPLWAWKLTYAGNVGFINFMVSASMIGLVIKKLQDSQQILNNNLLKVKQSEQQYMKLLEDQKLAEIKLQQLSYEQSVMLDNELVGIFKLQERTIVWVNNAIPGLTGYEKNELEGQATRLLYPDDEAYNKLGENAYPLLASGKTYRSQQTLLKKNGDRIWVDMHGTSLPGDNNESLWIMVDITALKKQREAIEAMAYHDVLTGLPNRLLLADRLEQALAHAKRNNKFVAVCYLDLDGFKPINDTYGHAAGDKLLAHIAKCMQVATRSNDTVSRLGGDEFVILLTNLETIDEYKVVLDRVISAINQAVPIDDNTEVFVTASIGISIYPSNSDNADSLLRFADEAMYVSKRSGRNCISLYQNTEN